jgi:vitamin K-dependent gamma-carboxylase
VPYRWLSGSLGRSPLGRSLGAVYNTVFCDLIPIAPLVYFRIAFGAIMLWEVFRYAGYGWIASYYIRPAFHFTYFCFDWIRPLPGDGMYWVFAALGMLAVCIAFGAAYRVSAVLFFLGFTYIFLLDETRYLNHFYLISLISFLIIFFPLHRAFSVDAWLRPRIWASIIPAWSLWILRTQLGLVYFFAGVAKLNGDWLHGEPMRMWMAERTWFPVIGQYFTEEWCVFLFSYGGLLLDLLAFPLLLWRRTRLPMLAALIAFHLMNAVMFRIGIFPWFMIAATLLFLSPEWFAAIKRGDKPAQVDRSPRLIMPVMLTCLGAYFAFQVAMPLRHFLYPGDVSWTEEGHRFAWHMKLRDKSGSVQVYVTDPAQSGTWEIDPYDFLTDTQVEMMATQPDMMVQFARYLADLYRADGYEVEVRFWAVVSLNGRPPRLLVDPAVDLSKEVRTIFASPWILR